MEKNGVPGKKDILVSICCITYNHEPYIKKALDGFVNQKTNFKYEIIIHDDASTDGTAEIIREYADKYPDLFVLILQEENMYSKGIKVSSNFTYPIARGKYIALCEGDDFWTDENKLQRQIDFLERHPEYSCCTHAHKILNMQYDIEIQQHPFNYTGTITTKNIIEGDGELFATASIVAKAELIKNRKPFQEISPVGDYPLIISLAFSGKIYYIDEVMSCYRCMVPGSWSSRICNDPDKLRTHLSKMETVLEEADRYSDFKYHNSFNYVIHKNWFNFYFKKESLRNLKKRYRFYYNRLEVKEKMKLNIKEYLPFIYVLVVLTKKTYKSIFK